MQTHPWYLIPILYVISMKNLSLGEICLIASWYNLVLFLCIITARNFGTHEPQHDKTNNMSVHPAKTQISLGIRPVWSPGVTPYILYGTDVPLE